jgi:hypothetical protein
MIDFVNATIPVTHEKLAQLSHSYIDFDYSYETNDDGVLLGGKASYRNCEVTLKPNEFGNLKATFKGSLHYWHNYPDINHDDFKFEAVSTTIDNICELFEVRPEQCGLIQVEYGVNISFDPAMVIDWCIAHNRNMFEVKKTAQKHISYCEAQRFTLKVYDKQRQRKYIDRRRDRKLYDERCNEGVYDSPILRIENKARQRKYLNDKGIYTLADLKSTEKMNLIANDLITKWNGVIFYDSSIDLDKLTTREQLTLAQARLGDSWKGEH